MKPSKRVLLIYPGQVLVNTYGDTIAVKSSLLSLQSYLRTKGVEDVEILDMALEHGGPVKTEDDLAGFLRMCEKRLEEYDFNVVGISCFSTFNYTSSVLVARLCRKINPGAVIVVGGWHCLVRPGDFTFSPRLFDFVVQGEGEKALLQIVEGRAPSSGKDATVIRGEPFDQDDYAGFDYDFEAYKAHCRSLRNVRRVETVEFNLSRQCPFTCSFCDNRMLGYRGWNAFSVEKSIELVNKAIAAFDGLKTIVFNEALFGMDRLWRRRFLSELTRLRHDISFMTQTRIDLLEEEDIGLLDGLDNMFCCFGVESLSGKIVTSMNKSSKPPAYIHEVKNKLLMLKELRTPFELYLILDHPGECHETQRETYSNLVGILDGTVYIQTFEYFYWLPAFVDSRELYHARYGTLADGDLEWWTAADPAGSRMRSRYVPSSVPNETFESAFERYRKWINFWKAFYRHYQREKPVFSIIEESRRRRHAGKCG